MKVSTTTCTLPPLADLLNPPRRPSSVELDVHHDMSPATPTTINNSHASSYYYQEQEQEYHPHYPSHHHHHHHHHGSSYHPYHGSNMGYRSPYPQAPLKAKRKRASPAQLSVLNHIFSQTYFPSTELRIELGKQLGMSPRAVQIWFQNKRQSLRTRERQQGNKKPNHPYYDSPTSSAGLPPISPPLSPPSWQHQQQHHHQQVNYYDESTCRPSHISLPPLQLPSTPSQSSYPSPTSIDSIILH